MIKIGITLGSLALMEIGQVTPENSKAFAEWMIPACVLLGIVHVSLGIWEKIKPKPTHHETAETFRREMKEWLDDVSEKLDSQRNENLRHLDNVHARVNSMAEGLARLKGTVETWMKRNGNST